MVRRSRSRRPRKPFLIPRDYDGVPNDLATYKRRDELLWHHGYDSYREYLQSEAWARIRRRILNRAGWRCQIKGCRDEATQVHHIDYTEANLIRGSDELLIAICRDHHRQIEIGAAGQKLDPQTVGLVAGYLSRCVECGSVFFRDGKFICRACRGASSRRLRMSLAEEKRRMRGH